VTAYGLAAQRLGLELGSQPLEIETFIDREGTFRTVEREVATDDTFTLECATAVDAKRIREHFTTRVSAPDSRLGSLRGQPGAGLQ